MNDLVKIGTIEHIGGTGRRSGAAQAGQHCARRIVNDRLPPETGMLGTHPPLSSDTPPVDDPAANPLGMAGLEFVEFAAPVPDALAQRFEQLGFKAIARHVSKNVTLYRQGQMQFLINAEPESFAARYAEEYGMGVCAIGLRVASARRAFERAIELGAWAFEGERIGVGELKIPAIQGIGDSHLYFVDR